MIVARTVMIDVPEAVGPWPVALMANVSLPLYLAFGLYSNVDALTFFSLPCAGFCEMAEAVIVPRIPMGNRQLSPDVTSMSPLEFSPQFASVTDIEHSEGAGAEDTGMTLAASMTSATAASFGNRVVDILILMQNSLNIVRRQLELGHRRARRAKSCNADAREARAPDAASAVNRNAIADISHSCALVEVAPCCPDGAPP
ncbi:hypothetical protein [Bradyrhizobium sp. ORS 86]|uniref:hypothetical protein n=1 Tax=Bradyrhizobium sp. ORS 86 TaxID=1685970 RepID=UPI00388D4DA3